MNNHIPYSGSETTTQSTHSKMQGQPFSLRAVFEHLFVQEKEPSHILPILGTITLLGLILRVLEINRPIAYDEAYTFLNFASRPFKHILADYSAPNNHILHTILVGIASRLFGGQSWVLRLPAFLAGTLTAPMMYLAARRFFSRPQALGTAALMAVTPVLIDYSVNGRGYTMLFLFALLLTNFAATLVTRQSKPALIAYGLTATLGFYTIPIFLYPMAGVSLWVVLTYLVDKDPWRERLRRLAIFLGVCILTGLLTLILYSPVIIFGSGLSSLIGNEFVESLDRQSFLANLGPRLINVWDKWMIGLNPMIESLFAGGFLLSLFFYRKVSNQKLPLQVCLALALVILLALQRVTPTPRIWLYLEVFYLLFAAAGLIWLADWLVRGSKVIRAELSERVLSFAILLVFIGAFINALVVHQQTVAEVGNHSPEEYTANYLADHLQPEDTLVATSPVDIETAYYLSLHGIPFDRFYKRDHPVKIQNAILLVRENSKYKTPESVVNFFKLEDELDVPAAELVFEYANVQVYSIPAK
ncbi:MAG TPA: glycosyltransferase family 39 protein [Anaerolineales bacterium]|nr:glycosyltransferase family 39 protein [Anaerolineales bacterium]